MNVFPHLAGFVTTWRITRLKVWLPIGGKTYYCCDLVGILHISLNEIVTWRVVNNSTVELGYGFCLEVDLELWFG